MSIPMIPSAVAAAVAAVLILASSTGCVTESKTRKPPPQPASIEPSSMLPAVQQPRDTDSNGYPDRLVISVFLFNQREYPQSSLACEGSWRFWLESTKRKAIAEWRVSDAEAKASLVKMGPGPCHVFSLNLLDHGTDVMDPITANLGIEFTSKSGQVLRADPTALRLGRMSQ